ALKAIKEDALDYLEKPIDADDLRSAVTRALQRKELKDSKMTDHKIKKLMDVMVHSKMAVPTANGFVVLENRDIVHVEACDSSCVVFTADNRQIVCSKSIRWFEARAEESVFLRIHRSHVVNLAHHLAEFKRTDGGTVVLTNGKSLLVSRRKLPFFMDRMAAL
ncbi:MAG: LytTR family transcriptional regulator DNA-binding domain-containing protein, partial [Flavobacteriales bacterium]|nr:LytTR family transcriptional regulator DNA-binding domain-containing protein [Flavobacteriales bacterium]